MKKSFKVLQLTLLAFFGSGIMSIIYSQNITNQDALFRKSVEYRNVYEAQREEAIQFARQNNLPVVLDTNGRYMEIQSVRNGIPQYYITDNSEAAVSISTNKVYPGGSAGLNLTGAGITAHEWDGGGVRLTHQEYGGRVTQGDSPGYTHYHATHVAGTIMASGSQSDAKGMAYQANLRAFDWDYDNSEMASEAATGALMSNHSYGFVRGWNDGSWYGDPSVSTQEDYLFGFYDANSQAWDQIAWDAPFYLIVKSAGNDRNDCGSGYPCDGAPFGYDCIGQQGVAKNILTVAAVEDVTGGYSGPGSVAMSSFSSWGPADDGRIKPDISANGVSLYSTMDGHDNDYASLSGTSMSSPSVTGSLALLQQHYENLNGTGNYMKAATLKAVVLHTADEAGAATGPDYEFGWGLMNTEKAAEKISEDQNTDVISELVLNDGNTYTRSILALGTEPLKVTIVWTDPAGTPTSPQLDPVTPMLVNDLDLKVSHSSTTHYPWKLDRNNPSNPATQNSENNVDNVEIVYIANPVAGNYTITIDHDGTLTDGSQAFSLVISGIDGQMPPVAEFNAVPATQEISQSVVLNDLSANNPTSWAWSVSGPGNVTYINGTSATSQNPEVMFSQTGLYDVTLTATNAYGSDIETKLDYIQIVNCSPCASTSLDASEEWISNVNINSINNSSGSSSGYVDYTYITTDVAPGNTYPASVTCSSTGSWPEYISIFVDWNQDCDFDDANETYNLGSITGPGVLSTNITVPSSAVLGPTRMRVSLKYDFLPSPCETFDYGEVEDYTLNIAEPTTGQIIELDEGWNLASFYVAPSSPDMLDIMQPLINNNQLIKVTDEADNTLEYVQGSGWVNNIGDMANTEGYYIKVNVDVNLESDGSDIPAPFTIPLNTGWNITGFPFDQPQNALNAVQPLIDEGSLQKVTGEKGGVIINLPGTGWMNTIGNFVGDEGYHIQVSNSTNLILNSSTDVNAISGNVKYNSMNTGDRSQHFTPVWTGNPYEPMAVVITHASIDGSDLTVGDEIGIYDTDANGDLFCVGAAALVNPISSSNPLIITASADDPDTPEIDGFINGNDIIYMVWDSETQDEIQNFSVHSFGGWDQNYTPLGTALDSVWTHSLKSHIVGETTCAGSAEFDVEVEEMSNIDGFDLCIDYDETILQYQGYGNLNPLINASDIYFTDSLTKVWVNWSSGNPVSLADDRLFSLNFTSIMVDSVLSDSLIWNLQHSHYYAANQEQHTLYSNGTYQITPQPSAAGDISGADSVCQLQQNVEYLVDPILYADEYIWSLVPASAGNLTIANNAVYINWNSQHSGNAILSVHGSNDCGDGESSSTNVYINALPARPQKPSGPDTLVKNPPDTQYEIAPVTGAIAYVWELIPDTAGVLYTNDHTALINWDDTYQGQATLTVAAVNNCGEGEFSEPLRIVVGDYTGVNDINDHDLMIYPVPAEDIIHVVTRDFSDYESVKIYSKDGRILIEQGINNKDNTIDISSLSDGVYVLHLVGKQTFVRKIIKLEKLK